MQCKQLYISQPTLSRHIQTLEKESGLSLVITSSHGIRLTRFGELAVPSFRKILREYDRFLAKTQNMAVQISGTLLIGVLYYAMDVYFSDFINLLEEKYPEVDFKITTYASATELVYAAG